MFHLLGALALSTMIAQGGTPSPGDAAFARGDFATAFREYNDAIIANPANEDAILGMATLDLYRNDWSNARTYLRRARQLKPGDMRVEERLATLSRRVPKPGVYRFAMTGDRADVPLVTTDPIPVIRANVNGRTLTLAVDTSARSIDLTAAAAQTLNVSNGALLATVVLPNLTVTGVPSRIVDRAQLPGMTPVDGWIGTVFLTHFLPTFDYAHQRLTLRRWESYETVEAQAKRAGAAVEPLWLIGDDLLVAQARVDGGAHQLFAIETGEPASTFANASGDATIALGSYAAASVASPYDPARFDGVPFEIGGTLGNAFFRRATLTLDFAAMKILVTR